MKIIKNIEIKWEPHDLWIGVYWNIIDEGKWRYKNDKSNEFVRAPWGYHFESLYIYVCLIPCFPIIIKKEL